MESNDHLVNSEQGMKRGFGIFGDPLKGNRQLDSSLRGSQVMTMCKGHPPLQKGTEGYVTNRHLRIERAKPGLCGQLVQARPQRGTHRAVHIPL